MCQVSKHKCIGCKFKMTMKLSGYDIDGVMLDLWSDVNLLSKNPRILWVNQVWSGHPSH
jgi:hypothetical protein